MLFIPLSFTRLKKLLKGSIVLIDNPVYKIHMRLDRTLHDLSNRKYICTLT